MSYDNWKTRNPADEELGPEPDVEECRRCNGSGEIACRSSSGNFYAAGPVPEDARGVIACTCDRCGGMGYVESNT